MRPGSPEGPVALSSATSALADTRPFWLWRAVEAADRFARLHFWGFTFFLVLLGAASVSPDPTFLQLALITAVGALFHNYAYVLNDVVDLPVDRAQPSRQNDFLVRGDVAPWQALVFALAQVPVALGLCVWAGVDPRGTKALLAAFVLMTIYDVWGKKCFCPPLTDLAQGLGWGGLVLFGAYAVGEPTPATWVAFASGAGFILLINGVHGGLRDLDNDFAQGSRTTAIFFGTRPGERRQPVGRSLRVFAMFGQLLLVATAAWAIQGNLLGYEPKKWAAVAMLQLLLQGLNLRYMWKVFRTDSPSWGRDFRLHIFLLLLAPALLFWPSMEGALRFLFPIAFVGPFFLVEVTSELMARGMEQVRHSLGVKPPAG